MLSIAFCFRLLEALRHKALRGNIGTRCDLQGDNLCPIYAVKRDKLCPIEGRFVPNILCKSGNKIFSCPFFYDTMNEIEGQSRIPYGIQGTLRPFWCRGYYSMEKNRPTVYQANPLIEGRKPMNALEMRLSSWHCRMSIHTYRRTTSTMTGDSRSCI